MSLDVAPVPATDAAVVAAMLLLWFALNLIPILILRFITRIILNRIHSQDNVGTKTYALRNKLYITLLGSDISVTWNVWKVLNAFSFPKLR